MKTSYTFTAHTYNEDTGTSSSVTVDFDAVEDDIVELCDKFQQFVNGVGYSYVSEITWKTEDMISNEFPDYSEPDISLDFSSEQPDINLTPNVSSNITLSQSDVDVAYAGVNGGYSFSSYGITPEQVKVDTKVRYSIDDATPEEWDLINRK